MGLGGYVISHNGAATVEVETHNIVHQFGMDPLQLEPFMKYCREHGVHFDVNTAFEMYVDQVEELAGPVRSMYENYLMSPSNLPSWEELSDPVVKFTVFGESADIDRVYANWSQWTLPFNIREAENTSSISCKAKHPRGVRFSAWSQEEVMSRTRCLPSAIISTILRC